MNLSLINLVRKYESIRGNEGAFFVVAVEGRAEFLRVVPVKRFAGEKIDHHCFFTTEYLAHVLYSFLFILFKKNIIILNFSTK